MADYICVADMGDRFSAQKSIAENVTEKMAMDEAYEMAFDVYEDYAGSNGIIGREDLEEEYPDYSEEEIEEEYTEAMEGWVSYWVEEITSETKKCPECGSYLSKKESENSCFDCCAYCGGD